jgi:hypothetical protein
LNHPQQDKASPLPPIKTNIENFIYPELGALLMKNKSFAKRKGKE